MKTLSLIIIVLMLVGSGACKKSENVAPADPIGDTQWHGLFIYKGETIQRVFTIRFDKEGGFLWQDLTGDYDGTWTLNKTNDRVTITFKVNGIKSEFSLLTGSELSSSQNLNHTTWTVLGLRKIKEFTPSSNGPALLKTQWVGSGKVLVSNANWYFEDNQTFTFRDPNSTNIILGRGSYMVSGRTIRINKGQYYPSEFNFFGVFVDDKTLAGHLQAKFPGGSYTNYVNEAYTKKP